MGINVETLRNLQTILQSCRELMGHCSSAQTNSQKSRSNKRNTNRNYLWEFALNTLQQGELNFSFTKHPGSCAIYMFTTKLSLILTRVNGHPVLFWEAKCEICLISLNIKYGSSKINGGLYFFFFKEKKVSVKQNSDRAMSDHIYSIYRFGNLQRNLRKPKGCLSTLSEILLGNE